MANMHSESTHISFAQQLSTPCQSPQGSLSFDQEQLPKQDDSTTKRNMQHLLLNLEHGTPGTQHTSTSISNGDNIKFPHNFFTQSSPPLPISPLSSFSRETCSMATKSPDQLGSTPGPKLVPVSQPHPQPIQIPIPTRRQRRRRSISMDRDLRKKLQHMKMTPTTSAAVPLPPSPNDQITSETCYSCDDGDDDGDGDGDGNDDDDDDNSNDTNKRYEMDAHLDFDTPTNKTRRSNSMQKPLGRHRLTLNNFILEKTVGTGSFGRVHLAQGRRTGQFYAIKALRKQHLVDRRQVEHANNERVILRSVDHPFVVKLWVTFQDDAYVFFVMDYAPGGELFRILRKNKSFSESTARFYAAEVLLAIEYLHHLDIAYRDIKPENILLDAQGHVKLADFGFSKKVMDLTWTVCGTPDYLAPEIIRAQGYTKAVDWWSFGVLIYEMVIGVAPFRAVNPVDKYQMILDCNIKYFPDKMTDGLVDLLHHLLKVGPEERYGNLRAGAKDIKLHTWFKKMDFEKLVKCQIKPPYIPDVKHAGDTSCFQTYTEPTTPYGSIIGDFTDDDDDESARDQASVGDPFAGF